MSFHPSFQEASPSDIELLAQLRSLHAIVTPKIGSELHTTLADLTSALADQDRCITDLETKINDDLQSQILILDSRLEDARALRGVLHRRKSQISSLFAPVRRLPTEILQSIFIFAAVCGKRQGGNTFGVFSSWGSTTLRISAVSMRWRTIALDMPILWSTFAVHLIDRSLDPAKLFLSRSKDTPLSIIMTDPRPGSTLKESPAVLEEIILHSNRWMTVDYHDIYDWRFVNALSEIKSLPLLENVLSVSGRGEKKNIGDIRNSPNLNHLIMRYGHSIDIDLTSLPLQKITKLTIQHHVEATLEHAIHALKVTSGLKTLSYVSRPLQRAEDQVYSSIHIPMVPPTPEISDHPFLSPVRLEHLTHLYINIYHQYGIYHLVSDLFQSITLPALSALRLTGDCGTHQVFEGEWPGPVLDAFFTRSQCQVRVLALRGFPITDNEVLAVLRHTPLIDRLILEECLWEDDYDVNNPPESAVKTITKAFVDKLRVVGDETPFLPLLDGIDLRVHGHNWDAAFEFVQMVKSRWYSHLEHEETHSRLVGAVLSIYGDAVQVTREAGAYEPLKELDADGMRVVVKVGEQILV